MENTEIPTSPPLDQTHNSIENSFIQDQKAHLEPACNCSDKPKGIPFKFWDEKKQKIRIEALLKSYKELERRLTELKEENDALLDTIEISGEEAQVTFTNPNSRLHSTPPQSPEEYDIHVDNRLFDNDPWINKVLHQAGFSNEQAQLVYDLAEAELMPIAEEIGNRYRMENDLKRLEQHFGGKARWREISRQIRNWASKNLPHHAYDALSSSYEGILAMHAMLDKAEEPSLLNGETLSNQLEEGDLRKLMKSPKYWQDRDPVTIRKVSEGFQRLYGNQ
ncbi:capsid assembly protein [Curvivirga sp.]|uniref:capsid assembly protein n=1 Tax=Curvivirga sp. TaxID=2856848 RepID=UPI003B595FE9